MVRVRRGNTDLEVGAELRLISIEYFRLSQEIEGYKPYEVFVERSTFAKSSKRAPEEQIR
jgi:hypothetical protein